MRIISGSVGGLRLQAPDSIARPTSDRVREALFSILADRVHGARLLDLFAGSGALGLEALSRGAASADFVDQDRRACEVIRRNLAHTMLGHPGVRIHPTDAMRFLRSTAKGSPARYDLVFADPPYLKKATDTDHLAELLASDILPALLNPDGLLVLETATSWAPPATTTWHQLDDRTYGGTRLWLWHL